MIQLSWVYVNNFQQVFRLDSLPTSRQGKRHRHQRKLQDCSSSSKSGELCVWRHLYLNLSYLLIVDMGNQMCPYKPSCGYLYKRLTVEKLKWACKLISAYKWFNLCLSWLICKYLRYLMDVASFMNAPLLVILMWLILVPQKFTLCWVRRVI